VRERGKAKSGVWLGGLDSNQDNQIQNLRSYQLNDLPADNKKGRERDLDILYWPQRISSTRRGE
jgi:hypothetical protein